LCRHHIPINFRNSALRDPIRQGLAVHQLHRERMDLARVFEAIDRGNMRMVQRRQDLRFLVETCKPFGIGREEVRQDFERDVTMELRVTRAINLAHAARTEQRDDLVRTKDSAWDHR